MTMTARRQEQRQRVLKAKVAMALYNTYGRVPNEQEIDGVYHVTCVLYKSVLATQYLQKHQPQRGQLALF